MVFSHFCFYSSPTITSAPVFIHPNASSFPKTGVQLFRFWFPAFERLSLVSAAPFHAPCFPSLHVQHWTYRCSRGLSTVWRGRSIPHLFYAIQLLTLSGAMPAFPQRAQRHLANNPGCGSQAGAEPTAPVGSAARVFLQKLHGHQVPSPYLRN